MKIIRVFVIASMIVFSLCSLRDLTTTTPPPATTTTTPPPATTTTTTPPPAPVPIQVLADFQKACTDAKPTDEKMCFGVMFKDDTNVCCATKSSDKYVCSAQEKAKTDAFVKASTTTSTNTCPSANMMMMMMTPPPSASPTSSATYIGLAFGFLLALLA